MHSLRDIYQKFRTFILYGLIGILSTGLEFLVYALLLKFMPYLYANVIGFHCGIFCSFMLNRRFNFKTNDHPALRFASFYLVQIVCLALNSLLLSLFVEMAGMTPLWGKVLGTLFTALLPFFLNKYITFRKP